MALSGSHEKELGIMHTSSPYNNNNNNNNNHMIRESSSETVDHGMDPDRFHGTGASVTPISVGSKLLKSQVQIPRYRECLKNHAANMGGNITDGCGEFMPSGDDGTLEALKCAACNCHRNFHRKEYPTTSPTAGPFLQLPPPLTSPSPSPSFHHHHHHRTPPPISLHHHPNWASSVNAPPIKMAFGGAATESSSEELNFTTGAVPPYGMAKKRFRTKFTQDQKEKMLEFAEKVGWRIPREDDPEVQRFCGEVGVKRQVLKVWMHNNKATSGKKQVQDSNESIN
ncbi:homeodomain-like protein [Tanacetum coccineum]|uniref:Homeodomain-like protein n=1 Tax=Tanacetum coccineum TaxID=301880 RepID=A0ABQ4XJJ1_9ASTR